MVTDTGQPLMEAHAVHFFNFVLQCCPFLCVSACVRVCVCLRVCTLCVYAFNQHGLAEFQALLRNKNDEMCDNEKSSPANPGRGAEEDTRSVLMLRQDQRYD